MPIEAVILAVGTVLASVTASIVAMYMMRPNRENVEAQTTAEDAKASESYANASKLVADELIGVRKQITDLNAILDARDKLIFQLTGDKADLQDWAERLVHQVQSLGSEPVPFRPGRKVKATS